MSQSTGYPDLDALLPRLDAITLRQLRALLVDRMTAPPAALERLSLREQRELVRILTRLLG